MTIRCPRCGTLYRRPSRPGGDTEATYRCARCRHVFRAGGEPPLASPPEPAPEPEVEPDEDRFVFGDDEGPTEDEAFPDEEEDDERERQRPEARPGRRRAEPVERGMTPARFALRSLLGVTLLYAVLSIYVYTNPEVARDALARLPLLGPTLAETRVSTASIQLANVRGTYLRVKGDHLIFVVTGTAVNQAPLRVKSILIEAALRGEREDRQVVFCGAAPRDLRDLSLREIALLQTLEPPKDWGLGPGEQADFLVAFAGPPAKLREFSAEVLAVQAPSRGGTATRRAAVTQG
jgi:hypothetical protein